MPDSGNVSLWTMMPEVIAKGAARPPTHVGLSSPALVFIHGWLFPMVLVIGSSSDKIDTAVKLCEHKNESKIKKDWT